MRSWLAESQPRTADWPIKVASGFVLLGLLFYHPLWIVGTNLRKPLLYMSNGEEDMKSVMQYLEANMAEGDAVYTYYNATLPFEYYASSYALDGVTIIDDYAHHPTEIRATLGAAREFFGGRRLIVVFQPHQYSRTRFLLADFAASFDVAVPKSLSTTHR